MEGEGSGEQGRKPVDRPVPQEGQGAAQGKQPVTDFMKRLGPGGAAIVNIGKRRQREIDRDRDKKAQSDDAQGEPLVPEYDSRKVIATLRENDANLAADLTEQSLKRGGSNSNNTSNT